MTCLALKVAQLLTNKSIALPCHPVMEFKAKSQPRSSSLVLLGSLFNPRLQYMLLICRVLYTARIVQLSRLRVASFSQGIDRGHHVLPQFWVFYYSHSCPEHRLLWCHMEPFQMAMKGTSPNEHTFDHPPSKPLSGLYMHGTSSNLQKFTPKCHSVKRWWWLPFAKK